MSTNGHPITPGHPSNPDRLLHGSVGPLAILMASHNIGLESCMNFIFITIEDEVKATEYW
jgi:hypothetical protein